MFFTMQKWEKITNKSIHWEAFNIGSHPQVCHVRYTQLSFCHGRFCQCGRSKKYSRIHQLTDECCAPCMVGKGIQSKRGLNFGIQSKRGLNLRILSVKMHHAFVVNCLTVLLCFIHSQCFMKNISSGMYMSCKAAIEENFESWSRVEFVPCKVLNSRQSTVFLIPSGTWIPDSQLYLDSGL